MPKIKIQPEEGGTIDAAAFKKWQQLLWEGNKNFDRGPIKETPSETVLKRKIAAGERVARIVFKNFADVPSASPANLEGAIITVLSDMRHLCDHLGIAFHLFDKKAYVQYLQERSACSPTKRIKEV